MPPTVAPLKWITGPVFADVSRQDASSWGATDRQLSLRVCRRQLSGEAGARMLARAAHLPPALVQTSDLDPLRDEGRPYAERPADLPRRLPPRPLGRARRDTCLACAVAIGMVLRSLTHAGKCSGSPTRSVSAPSCHDRTREKSVHLAQGSRESDLGSGSGQQCLTFIGRFQSPLALHRPPAAMETGQ